MYSVTDFVQKKYKYIMDPTADISDVWYMNSVVWYMRERERERERERDSDVWYMNSDVWYMNAEDSEWV
jgi:hypothetical protein